MPNSKLDIDDSILKKKLLITPDEEEDNVAASLLPIWSDEPRELETLFPNDGVQERAETIAPEPGACVKTKNIKDGNESKVFINICTSKVIPPPEDISDQELVKILDSDAPSDFKVPMSIGQGHEEKDKSGKDCLAHDVIINPVFFKKMMDNPLFHNFFVIATMEGLEEKYGLSLDKNGWTVLKNKKYHGTIPEQTVRTKIPLVQELSSVRQWTPDDIKSDNNSPLISEVGPSDSAALKSDSSVLIREESSTPLISEISSKSLKSKDKSSSKEEPKHFMEYVNNGKDNVSNNLEISISLPDTCTGNKISVKISEDEVLIETPKYYFQGYLPHLIDTKKSLGYFVTSTKELLLTLPVVS